MKDQLPVVSVCMITYNHENFIAQAIEGVLMQKTSFPIELVIADDCSSDGTRNICMEYHRRNPGTIKLKMRERNVGMITNFVDCLQSCEGKVYCELRRR